jgi:hypothetical protein
MVEHSPRLQPGQCTPSGFGQSNGIFAFAKISLSESVQIGTRPLPLDHSNVKASVSKGSSTMRNQRETLFVARLKKLLMYLCLLLAGCANSEKVDNRNYAFDTYYPTPNEIQLAQKRAQRYWAKNWQRLKNPTKYLAVYVTSIVQGDVNQGLYSKLINSQTTSSFFDTYSSLNASCIMIYDTATNGFVSNQGYASVDLPSRGAIAHWDGYTAKYIGW